MQNLYYFIVETSSSKAKLEKIVRFLKEERYPDWSVDEEKINQYCDKFLNALREHSSQVESESLLLLTSIQKRDS